MTAQEHAQGMAVKTHADAAQKGRSHGHRRASHAEEPLQATLRDPLLTRPRWSAIIWSAVLGILLIAAAAALWWGSVRTLSGQQLDTIVWRNMRTLAPGWLRVIAPLITSKLLIDGFVILCGVGAAVLAIVRKRWALLLQMTVLAVLAVGVHFLKYVLHRPVFDLHQPNPTNTSPSGHTMAIATALILLVMACGLAWRAWVSLFAVLATGIGGLALVFGQWHRPSDVIVSILLSGGLALLTFTFTRGSAMDAPGKRRSSPAIQIVSTLLVVGGLACGAWALYMLTQLWPGLGLGGFWVAKPACQAAILAAACADLLSGGLVLACRQATASPLSAVGLLGGPPKPTTRDRQNSRNDHVPKAFAARSPSAVKQGEWHSGLQ